VCVCVCVCVCVVMNRIQSYRILIYALRQRDSTPFLSDDTSVWRRTFLEKSNAVFPGGTNFQWGQGSILNMAVQTANGATGGFTCCLHNSAVSKCRSRQQLVPREIVAATLSQMKRMSLWENAIATSPPTDWRQWEGFYAGNL